MAADVTVAGASGDHATLSFDSEANAAIAQNLAAAISAGVATGLIIPADSKDGPPPGLPPGKTGEWIQSTPESTTLPPGYLAVINTSPDPTITGTGAKGQTVLSTGISDLTFIDVGGSGTVVSGGGDNRIVVTASPTHSPPPDGWLINTGNGNDQIIATDGLSDTINPGGGRNALQVGNGDQVLSTGDDTVLASGKGSETITATGPHSVLVHGQASNIFFVSDVGSATVFGGTGSDTFFGGAGPDLVHGGTGGNNILHAGTGPATLFGGGEGDQLFAAGTASAPGTESQVLHAGAGQETLFGGFGSGDNTFYAGTGSDQIIGGKGNDTFFAAAGNATITGGTGNSLFVFTNGQVGGQDLIQDFTSGQDTVSLVGYGANAIADALATQTVSGGGAATITLTDNTKITFNHVPSLTASDFS
jgi:Ca2+-binding RTX toxin-like protein